MQSAVASLPSGRIATRHVDADSPEVDLVELLCGDPSGASNRMAGLMASWHPVGRTLHLRRWHRIPLQVPVTIALWDERAGQTQRAWPAIVRDACPGGMSFTHTEPISTRRVAVLLRRPNGRSAGWLLRLTWCRFTRSGVYQSGGAVVRTLDHAEIEHTMPSE